MLEGAAAGGTALEPSRLVLRVAVGENRHDILETSPEAVRGEEVRTRRDADTEAVLRRELARHRDGLRGRNREDFVDLRADSPRSIPRECRDEAVADSRNSVRSGGSAAHHRRLGRLDRHDVKPGESLPQAPRDADDRPARADAADEAVEPASAALFENLGPRRVLVALRIERVRKLIGIEPAIFRGEAITVLFIV